MMLTRIFCIRHLIHAFSLRVALVCRRLSSSNGRRAFGFLVSDLTTGESLSSPGLPSEEPSSGLVSEESISGVITGSSGDWSPRGGLGVPSAA